MINKLANVFLGAVVLTGVLVVLMMVHDVFLIFTGNYEACGRFIGCP